MPEKKIIQFAAPCSIPWNAPVIDHECSVCHERTDKHQLLRLRSHSPRSAGKGIRPYCLSCLINFQPLLATDVIPVGTILAIHPQVDLTGPRIVPRDNVAIPRISHRNALQSHERRVGRAMRQVDQYAVVYDVSGPETLYVYTWSDGLISERGEDTLGQSNHQKEWWSQNSEKRVTIRRFAPDHLNDLKEFERRYTSALLRGDC